MMRRPALGVFAFAALLGLAAQGCTLLTFGGPPEPKPEPGAEDLFKQGEELLAKGKYKQAREAYGKVKSADPEKFYDPLVQIRLGDSYYEEGSYAEAEVEYRRFLELRPRNKAAPYVKYQLGMCNFKQISNPDLDPRFAEESVRHFTELLRDYPDNPYTEEAGERLRIARTKLADHEYFVGMYYYEREAYKAASKRFKGLVDAFPGSKVEPEALYYLADSYINLGRFDQAKDALAVLFQEHPDHRMAGKAKEELLREIPPAP